MNNYQIANIATFGAFNKAMTKEEEERLRQISAEIHSPLVRMDHPLTKEEEKLRQIDAEINRLEKQNQTIIGKMRPYMRVLAMGIEYARSKSIARAIGASILPYPYMVYLAYSAYTEKTKRSNPRKKTKRTKRK